MADHIDTLAVHAGHGPDPQTGAIQVPIYLTSTYVQSGPGEHKGFEYSSTQNPTRFARERAIAALEGGRFGRAFASGLAASTTVLQLLRAGDHVIAGDDLLTQNFPMIHAVGRASARAPRLIDLTWGRSGAPTVTLVGKGISFDTGGLDIKPAGAMLLMKKDMGGAAAVLALGYMIMGQKLDVRLRILIPAAENSISGDAFRPGDILKSRAGATVEASPTPPPAPGVDTAAIVDAARRSSAKIRERAAAEGDRS